MKAIFIILLLLLSMHSNAAETKIVTNQYSFKNAVKNAVEGDIIVIGVNAKIDLSEEKEIVIDKSIIIEGEIDGQGRRPDFINKVRSGSLLVIKANNVVIKNVEFVGYQADTKKNEILRYNKENRTTKGVYQYPITKGIHVLGNDVVIDNCEISGFSHAGIFAEGSKNLVVKNSFIHHNRRWGLGYGIALHKDATALIRNTDFDYNRHSIAGSGSPGQSYEALYNLFGSHHEASPLDMHGGKDRGDGTQIAGHTINIHHNIIHETKWPIFIHRGIAQNKVIIEYNNVKLLNRSGIIGYYNLKSSEVPMKKFIFRLNSNF